MIRYAIARPELAGFARIVALLASDATPETLSPFIAIRLRGFYRADLGDLVAYSEYGGRMTAVTYSEVEIDTSGT